ncbi:glycerol dehydrogenase [Sporosarcina sp. P13]|uniref:diol dehydratase small subunit n=1 Tax=Sporosarcina sp. P13 TaxID=2048263 RepID=UPI000C164578|nr:diol dehydratase small subunit [Sporosarcina sp. P13]PIC63229.1 glycerol dehydrogenase [Sporosarcina sp. P13]
MSQFTRQDYPLGQKRPEVLFTPTNKSYDELTLEAAMKGELSSKDLRISPETLIMHAEISENIGREQLGQNFRRAAELIRISDERILEIYSALRPNRSSYEELMAIANELRIEYQADENAKLVEEAAEVYTRRKLLRKDEE